ncbi:MAG: hypothetical protein LBR16_04405 [Treponema sp.]|jgi:hypothetical protein|nr:hypothetical protein [Treponema sp.]
MTREQYLDLSVVKNFIGWMAKRLDAEHAPFPHSYLMKRQKKVLRFESLFDAVSQYDFQHKDFAEFLKERDFYSAELKKALAKNDAKKTAALCETIHHWGEIRFGQPERFTSSGKLVPQLKTAVKILNLRAFDTERDITEVNSNSTWIKIYALLVDGFVMYGSRVGAGLCLLVRSFCEENKLSAVPYPISFPWGYGNLAGNNNPNKGQYKFPPFTSRKQRVRRTVEASWLLEAVLEKAPRSQFNKYPPKHRIRALEAALFMMGYSLLDVPESFGQDAKQ